MPELPTGIVTFLFTDVEGSTRLWEGHPDQMRAALAEHDALIEFLAERHGGQVVRLRGEGLTRGRTQTRSSPRMRCGHTDRPPSPHPGERTD